MFSDGGAQTVNVFGDTCNFEDFEVYDVFVWEDLSVCFCVQRQFDRGVRGGPLEVSSAWCFSLVLIIVLIWVTSPVEHSIKVVFERKWDVAFQRSLAARRFCLKVSCPKGE